MIFFMHLNESYAFYKTIVGTENGDVVGHIAYTAKLILSTKKLWNEKVKGGDPFHYGATYLERAKKYVKEMDISADWLEHWLVRHSDKRYYMPSVKEFGADYPWASSKRGKCVPWNQNSMLSNGF